MRKSDGLPSNNVQNMKENQRFGPQFEGIWDLCSVGMFSGMIKNVCGEIFGAKQNKQRRM